MKSIRCSTAFAVAGFLGAHLVLSTDAAAWSLKTHVWIAQEVLNDVLPDGQVKIAGNSYNVPSHVLNALRTHPDRYRMGHLGPDVFPDPVVGQITTHPGLKGGWQTDDFLKHVLRRAGSPEEIAFAYGFAGHAAGDVFAHSYVNIYSGDIFELNDEREVERRHFVLEKYIEARTAHPRTLDGALVDLNGGLGTATAFLRDSLILNNAISGQNARSIGGLHLTAMNEVRNAVTAVDSETQKVIARLTKWGADYFKKQLEIGIRLATAKDALKAAELSLDAQMKLLELKKLALESAIRAAQDAEDIIKKNPGLLDIQTQILAEQTKIAVDAAVFAARVAEEVTQLVNSLQSRIQELRGRIVGLACYALAWPPAVRRCRRAVNDLNGAISDLENQISGARQRQAVAEEARRIAEANQHGTKTLIDKLRNEYNKALADVASGALQVAIRTARTEAEIQERVLEAAQRAVEEAQKLQEKIEKELKSATAIIDEIEKLANRYNIVTLLIRKWMSDIDFATEEYIKASHRVGMKMLNNSGNPVDEYKEWFSCYGQVFVAHPKEIGQVGCLVKNFVEDVQDEVNRIIDSLPEILRWIIFPSREINRVVQVKVEPALKKAEKNIIGFITDPTTADFLFLLADPENATEDKLNKIYMTDKSKKKLLTFEKISTLIDADFPANDPYKFPALAHAVTLAKLTLLGPAELNALIRNHAGNYVSPRYGATVYASPDGNFTVLFDVVRSIDGNHQWQAYGLPWPRRIGQQHTDPVRLHYGHNHRDDPTKGLKFWVDPYLREKVFLALFPTEIVGKIGERAELKLDHYRFPSCPAHPFPYTQDASGYPLTEDRICKGLSRPEIPAGPAPWSNSVEFKTRFFLCNAAVAGERHWTIVASHKKRATAVRHANAIRASHPDLHVEAWEPIGKNRHWPVMAAACSDRERAFEARDVIWRRDIARDAFVWRTRTPWQALPEVVH